MSVPTQAAGVVDDDDYFAVGGAVLRVGDQRVVKETHSNRLSTL